MNNLYTHPQIRFEYTSVADGGSFVTALEFLR